MKFIATEKINQLTEENANLKDSVTYLESEVRNNIQVIKMLTEDNVRMNGELSKHKDYKLGYHGEKV